MNRNFIIALRTKSYSLSGICFLEPLLPHITYAPIGFFSGCFLQTFATFTKVQRTNRFFIVDSKSANSRTCLGIYIMTLIASRCAGNMG